MNSINILYCFSISHLINQSINQSINSIDRSVSQSVSQSINQSSHQLNNKPTNEVASWLIDRSVSQNNCLFPQVCHLVYVAKVETKKLSEVLAGTLYSLPYSSPGHHSLLSSGSQ